jgi:phosphatidate cytidylyltransferase
VKTRILAALVGIPPVLAAVFLAGPAPFGAIVLALALLALHEYLRLCAVEPLIRAAVLAAAVPVLIAVPAGGAPGVGAAALLSLALLSLWRVGDPARRFRGLAEGVLGLCYIGYGMACLWLLRMETAHGAAWLFLVLAATWAGDSAAFFIGSRFGRRRFSPELSPNKTWAGAVGGLAGSLAGGLLSLPLFAGAVPVGYIAATSLAVGLAGQLGDLFESLWKRAKGVKDSGSLIPGHGGILDRIDSLLIGIPVGYHITRIWGG